MLTWISAITYFGFVLSGLYFLTHRRKRTVMSICGYGFFVLLPATIAVPLNGMLRVGVWLVAVILWILWKTEAGWLPEWFSHSAVLNGTFALVCFSIFLGGLINHKDPCWIILCVPALAGGMLNLARARGIIYGSGRGEL